MKAKTDQWVESNIYRDKVEGMLKRLQKASPMDKVTVRKFVKEFTDYHGAMCFDMAMMTAIIAMIRLGWVGTGDNATRIPRLIKEMNEVCTDFADRLGEDAAQAAYNWLYERGVEIDTSESPWIQKQGYRS